MCNYVKMNWANLYSILNFVPLELHASISPVNSTKYYGIHYHETRSCLRFHYDSCSLWFQNQPMSKDELGKFLFLVGGFPVFWFIVAIAFHRKVEKSAFSLILSKNKSWKVVIFVRLIILFDLFHFRTNQCRKLNWANFYSIFNFVPTMLPYLQSFIFMVSIIMKRGGVCVFTMILVLFDFRTNPCQKMNWANFCSWSDFQCFGSS